METPPPQPPELILASASPRRREMLERLGLAFRVVPPRVEEKRRAVESAADYARRNAVEKARWVAAQLPAGGLGTRARYVVIAADTVVVLNDRILEKPSSPEHARAMLQALSGRQHEVLSGLCVLGLNYPGGPRERSMVVRTEVVMKTLRPEEIEDYVAGGEPLDKAGAYAIQGRASYLVREVRGSYTNVVGLPLSELIDCLESDFECVLFGARP